MHKKATETLKKSSIFFLNWYIIYWVAQFKRACPEGSEYMWQRGGREYLSPVYGRLNEVDQKKS